MLSVDYQAARQLGGNVEIGLEREVGVSYNPRLARVLSIIAMDVGITDTETIRAALYAAVFDSGLGAEDSDPKYDMGVVPSELRDLVTRACDRNDPDAKGCSIRGTLALDAVRHLHQTSWNDLQRASILSAVEGNVVSKLRTSAPENLVRKLEHAINLQRRRLAADQSRA